MKAEELVDRIKGKLVLIFGRPGVGKSVLGLGLSRNFEKPYILLVDRNYPEQYKKINPFATIIEADTVRRIYYNLQNPPKDADFLMIDSITSISSEFVGENFMSPRANVQLANFYDWAFKRLRALTPKTTVLVIAHERIKDFKTGEVGPRMNEIAIRHVDLMYRMVEEEGRRKLVKVFERKIPEKVVLDWEVVE